VFVFAFFVSELTGISFIIDLDAALLLLLLLLFAGSLLLLCVVCVCVCVSGRCIVFFVIKVERKKSY